MGVQVEHNASFSFLKSCITFAVLRSSGNIHLTKDSLSIWVSGLIANYVEIFRSSSRRFKAI